MSIIDRCHEPTILSLIQQNSSQTRKNGVYSDLTNTTKPSTQPICWGCLKTAEKISVCILCKVAHYCTSACQKKDWRFHKLECSQMKEILLLKNASEIVNAYTKAVKETLLSPKKATSDCEPTPESRDQRFSLDHELQQKSVSGDIVSELLATLRSLSEIKNISFQPTQPSKTDRPLDLLELEQLNATEDELKEKRILFKNTDNKSEKKALSKEIVLLEIKYLKLEILVAETQIADRKRKLAKRLTKPNFSKIDAIYCAKKSTLLDNLIKINQEMKLGLNDLEGAYCKRPKHTLGLTQDERQYLLICYELRYKKYKLEINYSEVLRLEYKTYHSEFEVKKMDSIITTLKELTMQLLQGIHQQKKAQPSVALEKYSYEDVD